MIYAGIDAGSRTMKVALVQADGAEILATDVADQSVDQNALADRMLGRLLADRGLCRRDIRATVATGYGRKLIRTADETITEITCQARGVRLLVPGVRTIVDIGGQDSKLIWLGHDGSVADFVMNDRCAAGTGRFLEVVSARLGAPIESLGEMAARSREPAAISSMCVVFAETEIIGLLATGAAPEDIVAGVQASVASRVAAMASQAIGPPLVFTGGVALVPGMETALSAALGVPALACPQCQVTAAIGAALLAMRTRHAD